MPVFILYVFSKMKLTLMWKVYDLEVNFLKYLSNNRTAVELYDYKSDEPWPFCCISENHPEIPDEVIYGRLLWHEMVVIDNDFVNCFPSEREAKIWIRDNIPQCVITWDYDWLPVFYIQSTKENVWGNE